MHDTKHITHLMEISVNKPSNVHIVRFKEKDSDHICSGKRIISNLNACTLPSNTFLS